jgi:DNA segregation ATPase FtsK/SpoIIIE, S-DNA-T family
MANIFSIVSQRIKTAQTIQTLADEFEQGERIVPKLKDAHRQELLSIEQKFEIQARKIQRELTRCLSLVLACIQLVKDRADGVLLDELASVLAESSRTISGSHLLLDRIVEIVNGERQFLDTPSRQVSNSWENERWWKDTVANKYIPRIEGLAPMLVRVGTLRVIKGRQSKFEFDLGKSAQSDPIHKLLTRKEIELSLDELPLLLQCRTFKQGQNSGHIVIFSNSPETRQAATTALESIALRAIATFPARKLQGIFIDPVSMGNTFPFKSLPEEIRGKRTYTTSDDIQEQLHKLIGHTEQVIYNYLSRDFDNIEAYNAAAEAIQEAYRYLFIADFSSKFDNKSFEYLNSLLVNGSRAGVYTVIHIDETLEKPRNFNYELFKAHCQILRPAGKSYNGEPLFVYEFSQATVINAKKDDTQLAGDDDVNLQIVNYIVKAFLITYGVDLRKDRSALQRLNEAAEMAKIELSTAGVTEINLPFITATQERPLHLEISLNRSQFKQIYSNLPDRSYTSNKNSGIVCYATLDKPPESDRFNQLTAMISKASGEVKVDTVAFSQLYPATLWTGDSRGEIRTAIGVAGAREKLEFWLGQNPKGLEVSQSLLFGKPGAGKSYTLHSIINGLAMRYAPDELELYLLDFKEGVEFQVYVDPDRGEDSGSSNDLDLTKALPHAKVISIESDREFGLSVLRKVNEQFQIRANEWKSVSNDITKVAEYRNKTNGKKMPRILIVIDEFQVLFEDNDSISAELNQIFDTIVKKGRAFGIHLLLASQSPNIKNITRSVYDLIDLRMAMQMNQNVAAMTLAEGNTDAVDLLDRPGRIIYNSDFGRKGSNEIGQVADASTDQRKKALRKIQETVQATGYQRPPTDQLVVFDGRHPTRLRNNGLLTVLASADAWLSPADIKDVVNESNWRVRDFPSIAWVGEAMQIGYHSRAIFRRRSRSNMLIVGNIEENIFGILGGVMTSLVCSHQPQKAEFHIIDLSDEDDRGSHWSNMTLNFREAFSTYFPITIAKDFADSDRQISKANTTLQNISAEFERRKQLREADPDTTNFGASIFFVAAIGTLERLNSLRPTVDNRGNPDMSDDAKKLMAIASQGAEIGIHLILWVEGIKTLNQLFAGKERISLSNFDLRIGLTMPTDDSRALFNETLAANLTKLRAYFKDEATAANLEKFKPYAVPTKQEFATYVNYLEQKR